MCHCERVTEHYKVTEHWIIVIPCHYFSATEHYEVTEHWIIIIPCHYFSATDHRYIIIPCHYFTIPCQYLIVKVTVHWLIAYTPGLMGLIIAHWLISCLHLTTNGLVTPFGSKSYPPDLYYCDVQRFGSYGHVDISYFKGDCHSLQVADIEHYMSSTESNSSQTTLIDIKATSTTCEVFEIWSSHLLPTTKTILPMEHSHYSVILYGHNTPLPTSSNIPMILSWYYLRRMGSHHLL
eukprot:scaffold505_cov98-Skeletonema_dohrnii-CCMP3373.AAC.1